MGSDSVVLVADEARLEWEATIGYIWYPKGKQPEIKVHREKKTMSYYGALNVKTGEETVMMSEWQNSHWTSLFLEKILNEYPDKRVLLIWDGSPTHKGEVKDYLKGKHNLELMKFPPYSPELNPQEHVWREARRNVSHNHEISKFDDLVNNFYNFLTVSTFRANFLKKYTQKIKSNGDIDNKYPMNVELQEQIYETDNF